MDVAFLASNYKDQFGGTTTQIMPMLRGSYRLGQQLTFDADCGYQRINYSGSQSSTATKQYSYSAGLHWDF